MRTDKAAADSSEDSPNGSGDPGDLTNKSVLKAMRILTKLGENPHGATATELAQVVGVARPTVFRILLSMEQAGFVGRSDNTYTLGWELARLGRIADPERILAEKIRPVLDRYSETIGETVNFAVARREDQFEVIVEGRSGRLLNMQGEFIGQHFPAHASSSGKVLLAELSDERLMTLLPETLETFTPQTLGTRTDVLADVARVRERGYAFIDDELEVGLFSLSVPVRNFAGGLAGVMAVHGPSERIKGAPIEETVELLQRASLDVARTMGAVD